MWQRNYASLALSEKDVSCCGLASPYCGMRACMLGITTERLVRGLAVNCLYVHTQRPN